VSFVAFKVLKSNDNLHRASYNKISLTYLTTQHVMEHPLIKIIYLSYNTSCHRASSNKTSLIYLTTHVTLYYK